MARATFGGTAGDFLSTVGPGGQVRVVPGTLTLWSAETAGTQYTDLLLDGGAVTTISVGRDGQVPTFQGPDGIGTMWADGGGADRVRLLSDKTGEALASDAFIATQLSNPTSDTFAASDAATAAQIGDAGSEVAVALERRYVKAVVVGGFTQADINAAKALVPTSGGHLHFPAGTYTLTAGTTFNGYSDLTITGDNALLVVDASMPDNYLNTYPNYGADSPFRFLGCQRVKITGLRIDGNITSRTPYGPSESFNSNLLFSGCTDVTIEGNELTGAMTDNITLVPSSDGVTVCSRFRIINNRMKTARRNNISVVGADDVLIEKNTLIDAGTVSGISPKSNLGVEPEAVGRSKNIRILNNVIAGAAGPYGAYIGGRETIDALIQGNTFDSNAAAGLNIDTASYPSQSIRVIANTFRNHASGAGVRCTYGHAAEISLNTFRSNKWGVVNALSGSGSISRNRFVNNAYGGVVATDFLDLTVDDNYFENNATAAAITDGGGHAVYGTPTSSASILNANGNRIVNLAGTAADSLMKGIEASATCNARGNNNTGQNLNNNAQLLRRVQGIGNNSIDSAVTRQRYPAGEANFDDGLNGGGRLLIGSKLHYHGTAAPTSGTWERGDLVYNTAPAIGKALAWTCLVAGSPGAWQPVVMVSGAGANRGDADATVVVGTDNELVQYTTTLTADRTLALSTTGAFDGARFRVRRSATGAFNLNVTNGSGGSTIKALAAGQWADVIYNGAAWIVTAAGTL